MFRSLRKNISLKNGLSDLFHSFQRLVYPAVCLHCGEELPLKRSLLCTECFEGLELLLPRERCVYCFSPQRRLTVCKHCEKHPPLFHRVAAVFEYHGPAATLVKKMKYSNLPYLSEGLAAYMVLQFILLKWPKPDLIVPVPISFTHWIHRGYNQSYLLAKEIGKLLNCPVLEVLGRKSGDYSQAGLNHAQREALEGSSIYLKKKGKLPDQTVLLIDDVLTTGTTLRKCAEILEEDYPFKIYGLTTCCGG